MSHRRRPPRAVAASRGGCTVHPSLPGGPIRFPLSALAPRSPFLPPALALTLALALAPACSDSSPAAAGASTTSASGGAGTTSANGGAGTTSANGGAGTTSTGTTSTTGSGGAPSTGGAGGGDGAPAACGALGAAIAASIGASPACTGVVRLAYETKAPIAFALICGPKVADLTVEAARATAQADTGFGLDNDGGIPGTVVSPPYPNAPDELVFFQPIDLGGVGVVSADTGRSVFGGSVVWMGTGEVTWPKDWQPAADLGAGCPAPVAPKPKVRAIDLTALVGSGPAAPSDADVSAAFDVAWGTALGGALAKRLAIGDSLVLLYAPAVGDSMATGKDFDPAKAEYVVFLNAR